MVNAGLILMIFSLFLIDQTRGFILGFFIFMFLLFILSKNSWFFLKRKKLMTICFCLFIVLAGAALGGGALVKSLDPNGNSIENRNVDVRLTGIQFYWSELVKTYFIGTGWISTKSGHGDNEITRAIYDKKLFADDLGVLGSFFMYGIPALFIYFYFFKKSFSILKESFLSAPLRRQPMIFTLGLFLLLQLTTPTLGGGFYWPEFALFFGVIMYLVDASRGGEEDGGFLEESDPAPEASGG
jgi:hypothetical protein